MRFVIFFVIGFLAVSCTPKESIVLRAVNIVELVPGKDGMPVLKADVVFFNPNSGRMKLRKVVIDIFVDEKQAGRVDQKLNTPIKANSEFTVPVEVQLHLKDSGLVDTLLSFMGGKKHEVRFVGKLKISVNGFPVKIPVDHKEQVRL